MFLTLQSIQVYHSLFLTQSQVLCMVNLNKDALNKDARMMIPNLNEELWGHVRDNGTAICDESLNSTQLEPPPHNAWCRIGLETRKNSRHDERIIFHPTHDPRVALDEQSLPCYNHHRRPNDRISQLFSCAFTRTSIFAHMLLRKRGMRESKVVARVEVAA